MERTSFNKERPCLTNVCGHTQLIECLIYYMCVCLYFTLRVGYQIGPACLLAKLSSIIQIQVPPGAGACLGFHDC